MEPFLCDESSVTWVGTDDGAVQGPLGGVVVDGHQQTLHADREEHRQQAIEYHVEDEDTT